MRYKDHLFFALVFLAFGVIAGAGALAFGALGAPLPCIGMSVGCSLCFSRVCREWDAAKNCKRFGRP